MAQKRRRTRKAASRHTHRWLALAGGLALCAGALYVLGAGRIEIGPGEIDAASRSKLERVLEREDRVMRP